MKRKMVSRIALMLLILVMSVGLLLLLLLMWGNGADKGTVMLEDEQLVDEILIDYENLPRFWGAEVKSTDWLTISGYLGKSHWFGQSASRPWVNIREDVFVLSSIPRAEDCYQAQLKRYGRLELQGWEAMPQLRFSHHADEMHVACTEAVVNGYHHFVCRVVGRYGRVVTMVGGNVFDHRWLTMEQFQHVLIEADRKVLEALGESPWTLDAHRPGYATISL